MLDGLGGFFPLIAIFNLFLLRLNAQKEAQIVIQNRLCINKSHYFSPHLIDRELYKADQKAFR